MFTYSNKYEIDHHAIKLLIGLIALSLANLTSLFSFTTITSISASYYEDGWARNILVGFLFAISAFMLSYNGYSRKEMILSKIAAIAALGVAMFPCKCGDHVEILPYVHYASAGIMFMILAKFCELFSERASNKGYREARWRSKIYVVCGFVILSSMAIMLVDAVTHYALSEKISRLTFYCERAGLMAFGISWLTASRALPLITAKHERYSPFA